MIGRLCLIIFALGLSWPAAAADKLTVYTVNYPLAYFAERIGGDAAEVVFPAPQGQDPAFWEPSPEEIAAFQQADIILLNGAGYARWVEKASLPRARTVETSKLFADRFIPADTVVHTHADGSEHSHGAFAAITWLDFSLAAMQAEAVATAMIKARPDQADAFSSRLTELQDDLAELDNQASKIAYSAVNQDIAMIASHPVYQYFARAYGLTIDSLVWEPEDTPSEKQWIDFDAFRAGAERAVMLWEATPSQAAAQGLADRGGVGTVFDPAGNRGEGDFLERMRANLDDFAAATTFE
jgi:zinc transport system substrate-binding protein